MKEYIERSAAMESILGLTIADSAVAQYADAVYYNLQRLPAADVVEVRHGRWVFEPGKIPYCSECKEYSDDGDKGATICPWCGTRMDKEDEHETD